MTAGRQRADIAIAVAFVLLGLPAVAFRPVAVLVLLVFGFALAIRRWMPALSLATAWLAAVLQMLTGQTVQWADLAVLAVLFATAAYGDRITRWSGLISAGVGALIAAAYLTVTNAIRSDYFSAIAGHLQVLLAQFLFLLVASCAVLGLSWVLGMLVRTWRNARASRSAASLAEAERLRAEEHVVIEQERNRIARDMHDVVAHSLAVVIAQADGARYAAADDPAAVDSALGTISSTARQALGDVRTLLAELRHSAGEGPAPTLADLPQLVTQLRGTGLDIREESEGVPLPLGTSQQIAAYRIVQEALTNALRHGDVQQPVLLRLEWAPAGLQLRVRNALPPVATGEHPAAIGHGIPGMRERALLAGGHATAERSGRAFLVTAFLPGFSDDEHHEGEQ